MSDATDDFTDPGRPPDWSFYSYDELRAAKLPAPVGDVLGPGGERRLVLVLEVVANSNAHSRLSEIHIAFSSEHGLTEEVIPYQLDVCHGREGDTCDEID